MINTIIEIYIIVAVIVTMYSLVKGRDVRAALLIGVTWPLVVLSPIKALDALNKKLHNKLNNKR